MPVPDYTLQSRRFKQIRGKVEDIIDLFSAIGADYKADGKEDLSEVTGYFMRSAMGYKQEVLSFTNVLMGKVDPKIMLEFLKESEESMNNDNNTEDVNNGDTNQQLREDIITDVSEPNITGDNPTDSPDCS